MNKRTERLVQVIELLADGEFHSGEAIGAVTGVTRASVNQDIKAIQALGLDVFKVVGKGYRLAMPIELLDVDDILKEFAQRGQKPLKLHVERIVSSTNDVLRSYLKQGPLEAGETLVAEAQTDGRGRRGKRWYSPYASSLYLSMYWPLEQGMAAAMGLSIVAGYAVADAARQLGIADVRLKWPNDVLVKGKKLSGILIELEGQAVDNAHAIIGIGVNINLPTMVEEYVDQPWTDLQTELGQRVPRNLWVATLLATLSDALEEFKQQGLSPFVQRWLAYDNLHDRAVTLLMGQTTIHGYAKGIAEDGALLVEVEGEVKRYHAGEVSLRYDAN
ncbi:bifunctional biotin--[acetyl-CoA-carboxylase] synthetase/biotin operon repressor [Pseudidiomarina sediminum]|uniref:Bifunctional ligase/repressor BirA n=1 Tax=Pseudidiomarina sediminum TaxID=431675 RepID=A0A432Z346_9GAMM|nr:bifunctional biotin--[acetyl-CoA-carboxylase] ligase/biotin operon repressor BirA [Pseudidiomarina sediminum]RUO72322.1 bifunctional biotin--[acetyl-CoA-carboxylase] synthetase/biotin operon repressor [Pseudidiomarina sediminum]